jgi:uncharacterized protein
MRRWLATLVIATALPAHAYVTNLLPSAITTSAGKAITLKLEMALTPETRERGLMQRKTLKPADGMVFFFPKPAPYQFWMKDTVIPLDMLFVDEAGTVVYIATAKPLSLKPVGPTTPVDTVIELAGGRAAHEGITVGDKVSYAVKKHPRSFAR